jgi:SAM-dependent methyltransferase
MSFHDLTYITYGRLDSAAVTPNPAGWAETNRRMWDERVPIHLGSNFYDVAGFKAGKPAIEAFEVEELGALGGLRLVHLQCHFGLDTLDLVRLHPNLVAVGLDFSGPAVAEAHRLARELELDTRAHFVQADVYNAVETLGRRSFDVVYTGKGALCWLPDLRRWAEECAALIKPGGWLYVCDFHPLVYALDDKGPAVVNNYFSTEPIAGEWQGSYADRDARTVHNLSYEWPHPLPQIFEAILGAGFDLRFYHEWDYAVSDVFDWLVKRGHRRYEPPGPGRLPLMYSLKAQKRPEPPSPPARS